MPSDNMGKVALAICTHYISSELLHIWLAGRPAGWPAGWLAGRPAGWLAGWLDFGGSVCLVRAQIIDGLTNFIRGIQHEGWIVQKHGMFSLAGLYAVRTHWSRDSTSAI